MRTRSRIFQRTRAIADRGPALGRRLHSLAWLHVLGPDDLNDLTVASYNQATGFETPEHNLNGLWDWEERAFARLFGGATRVIVAGAGGGREMIALAKMGLDVFGFDASSDLVAACGEHLRGANVSAQCVFAAPGEVPAGPASFDALVIGRGVYHHIPGSARRVAFLAECAARVASGSPMFLGDFLTRPDRRSLNDVALKRSIERGDSISASFFHHFTNAEIVAELGRAGFAVDEVRDTPHPGSAMAHALAHKRA